MFNKSRKPNDRLTIIDDGIDDFKVFDDIINNDGYITTIDDNVDKQPRVGEPSYYYMTLSEIGKAIGVNKERVRQIQEKAMLKLSTCRAGDRFEKEKRAYKDFY